MDGIDGDELWAESLRRGQECLLTDTNEASEGSESDGLGEHSERRRVSWVRGRCTMCRNKTSLSLDPPE